MDAKLFKNEVQFVPIALIAPEPDVKQIPPHHAIGFESAEGIQRVRPIFAWMEFSSGINSNNRDPGR